MVLRIDNEVLVSQADRDDLRRLFRTVKATPEYRKTRRFGWWIFWRRYWSAGARFCSRDEIEETIDRCIGDGDAWPEEFRRSLPADLKSVAEFRIQVYDRTGLGHYPSHVAGWVYLFYVNPQSGESIYWMRSLFSVYGR